MENLFYGAIRPVKIADADAAVLIQAGVAIEPCGEKCAIIAFPDGWRWEGGDKPHCISITIIGPDGKRWGKITKEPGDECATYSPL